MVYKNYIVEIRSEKNSLVLLLMCLKYNSLLQYKMCVDIVCFDNVSKQKRFTLIYYLVSVLFNRQARIIVQVDEFDYVDSVVSLFSSTSWSEREIWDLFGVMFSGNTDLRRLLTDYGFKGFPFRRDFPLSGFYELHYNEFSYSPKMI